MKNQAGLPTQAGNSVVWFVIVLVVIGALVYITIKGQRPVPAEEQLSQAEQALENINNTDSVEITVVAEGEGEPASEGDTVAMNYTGKLDNGMVFDSNVDSSFGHMEPFVFTIGAGQVISGWDIGVSGMRVGEKRILVISPEYAYGEFGVGGIIPPNATLTFEVELIAVQK